MTLPPPPKLQAHGGIPRREMVYTGLVNRGTWTRVCTIYPLRREAIQLKPQSTGDGLPSKEAIELCSTLSICPW
ncbi:hypothetical protein BABINDRAFT_163420 [Babjeviella inositovora NRRL Y-12698]|uniref:Uncharacterized protein n=1 Tax=Babjeviella inositovora NRRL Y-12698 TaxID=984486 RepID=A0A1E3QJ19_9ASCO|nr:uncharacterized protein BABINDRAFT_163420 [Babjeviella inositovora NRRL Y-12698]ODQ77713.1 hypothetical protein BABINDRAFT_163420 [Babjeviella inositovora NRRL Y-12698]